MFAFDKNSYPELRLSGNDVYVGGEIYIDSESVYKPVIWKNGVLNLLSNYSGEVKEIKIDNGVVYAVGYLDSFFYPKPVYWENGILHEVSNVYGNALTILISGNDVYAAGYTIDTVNSGINHASIWKNGNLIFSNNNNGAVNSLIVSGSDLYAAGYYQQGNADIPIVWKNGVQTNLSNYEGTANHVLLNNNDVYITGYEYDSLVANYTIVRVWKNNVPMVLNVTLPQGIGQASAIVNSNIYTVGTDINSGLAKLWINGVDSSFINSKGYGLSIFAQ